MSKIAIMTWFMYGNFGSILQAYALGKYLTDQGHHVKYVNYYPNAKFKRSLIERLKDKDDVKRKIRSIVRDKGKVQNIDLEKRISLMDEFISEYFDLTDKCETNSELFRMSQEFDVFIAGSDQIWSPSFFDEKFYLGFLEKSITKVAYSPSFGTKKILNSQIREQMGKLISEFDCLSVREDTGKDIIRELCGRDAVVTVDPTMLLSKEEWHLFAKEYSCVDTKTDYLLVYFLGDNKKYDKYLEKARNDGLRVVIIPSKISDYCKGFEVAKDLTPEQFVYLFEHAKCVCTDSFHGTVFSILFNKPFLTVERFGINSKINQNERLHSLLSLTKLEGRYTDSFSIFKMNTMYTTYKADASLDNRISASVAFLQNALTVNKRTKKQINKTSITTNCSGCGVCALACHKEAITIEKNQFGFYYANINKEKCVGCGLCSKICGFSSKYKEIDRNTKVFSARVYDTEVLMNSSSGGFADSVVARFFEKGYSVIGCKYDLASNEAIHCEAKTRSDLQMFRGSKYLQSHLDVCLREHDLKKRTIVVGTPCQIASLSEYLSMCGVRNNYILIDLICHGVPSYNMWYKYLKYISNQKNSNFSIKSVMFRKKNSDKTNQNMNIEIVTDTQTVLLPKDKDIYLKMFCLGNSYNTSCYNCNFRHSSAADLRIGDYWGEKFSGIPGTSMVICLTEKGHDVISQLGESMEILPGNVSDYYSHQQVENTNPPDYYWELMSKLNKDTIDIVEIYKEYCADHYRLEPIKKIIRTVIHII